MVQETHIMLEISLHFFCLPSVLLFFLWLMINFIEYHPIFDNILFVVDQFFLTLYLLSLSKHLNFYNRTSSLNKSSFTVIFLSIDIKKTALGSWAYSERCETSKMESSIFTHNRFFIHLRWLVRPWIWGALFSPVSLLPWATLKTITTLRLIAGV